MKYIITIIFILSLNPVKACECVEFEYSRKHIRQFYNWYDKVFIGNLLENKAGKYKFEVIQGFKNCQFGDTLWGKYNNSCSITPSENGLWIVYASIQDSTNTEIDIDGCNSTRNLKSNRQSLHDQYDTNSDIYNLKDEQANKIVEVLILEQLNIDQKINEKSEKAKNQILPNISEKYKQLKNNWLSIIAITLSIIAILMNLQIRNKASRKHKASNPESE